MNQRAFSLFFLATTCSLSVVAQAPQTTPTDSLKRTLEEVVVRAQQAATKLVGNTLVSTIPGTSLQNLGTCLDVLAQLPLITVTDDAVSVVGKGSPEIFIDGRPMRDNDELRQMRSDNISKVELIMAPGAMYSSETRAVLKITTRHNFLEGLSMTERGEVTARRRWSANDMLDLNYRSGAIDVFATVTIARNNSLTTGSTINTLDYQSKTTIIGSSQHNILPSVNGTIKGGINYASGNCSLGAYYRFNPERGNFKNTGSEWLDNETPLNRLITRNIHARNHLVSAYYDDTFADRYLLHFDGLFRRSLANEDVTTTYPEGKSPDVTSTNHRSTALWAGKLYLRMPLGRGSLTVGTQESYTRNLINYRMLNTQVEEYIPSSLTDSRQTSAAAFASWDSTFGPFNLSAGLRYEYTDYVYKIDERKDNDVSSRDHLLTPDISLGWDFGDRLQISLSYKMATVRPPYSQLSGSLSYVGRHEIEGGNTALRDERMHQLQLFGMWRDFILQAGFTRSIDTYAFVKRLYPAPALQLLMQPVNIDVSAASLYLVWNKTIRAWSPSLTFGMYRQWLDTAGSSYRTPIFSYYFENTISLPNDFLITLNASGRSAGYMHTNRFGATPFTMDASVSKSFFKKALQAKLSATDIFNTFNSDWSMHTYGINVEKHQRYDIRGVSLTLTYHFQPRRSNYKGSIAAESELNRL